MDLSETDREIEITVKESDIQRNVGRMFWRSAVKRRASEETKKDYHLVERGYASFTRAVQPPEGGTPTASRR